jgi:hypothetical protein
MGAIIRPEFAAQFLAIRLHRLVPNLQLPRNLFRRLPTGDLFQYLLFTSTDPERDFHESSHAHAFERKL